MVGKSLMGGDYVACKRAERTQRVLLARAFETLNVAHIGDLIGWPASVSSPLLGPMDGQCECLWPKKAKKVYIVIGEKIFHTSAHTVRDRGGFIMWKRVETDECVSYTSNGVREVEEQEECNWTRNQVRRARYARHWTGWSKGDHVIGSLNPYS